MQNKIPDLSRFYLSIVLVLCSILLVTGIFHKDLQEWDESRNGVNANEMLHNQDYVNLYYGGQPDTWNAKPPLMTWCIVLCYKIFGLNEVSLRLPAGISTLLFFIVFFRLVKMMEGPLSAFLSCLILLGCSSLMGLHAGITADYDTMLMLFLVLSAYYFIRFTDFGEFRALYAVALFTGLAFYTKGTAAVIFLPGFLLYLVFKGKVKLLLTSKHAWGSFILFAIIVLSWVLIAVIYAAPSDHSFYGSKNAIETMLVHDTYRRLTSKDFGTGDMYDGLFFIKGMDMRMNLWNYLFYISAATGLFMLYKNRSRIKPFVNQTSNRFTVFSICIAVPVVLVLNFSLNMHDWYFVPVWGFIAFITVKGIRYWGCVWKITYYGFAALCVFTIVRQFLFLYSLPDDLNNNLSAGDIMFKNKNYIVLTDNPKQNMLVYLGWIGNGFQKVTDPELLPQHAGKIIIIQKDKLATYSPYIRPIKYFDEYCMGEIY